MCKKKYIYLILHKNTNNLKNPFLCKISMERIFQQLVRGNAVNGSLGSVFLEGRVLSVDVEGECPVCNPCNYIYMNMICS